MPSLVVAAAAYAAYKQNQKQQAKLNHDGGDDDENATTSSHRQNQDMRRDDSNAPLSLENKTLIPLLHGIEQEANATSTDCHRGGMCHAAPISTITFCHGNPMEASQIIGNKFVKILQSNPWLAGWIIRRRGRSACNQGQCDGGDDEIHPTEDDKTSTLHLCFDPECKDVSSNQEMFQLFLPSEIELSQKATKYQDFSTLLESNNLLVERNEKLVLDFRFDGNKQITSTNGSTTKPLFKVSIIPDVDDPNNRYSVVVSMSHLLGDACTYYKIWNMLLNNERIVELPPSRWQSFHSVCSQIEDPHNAEFRQHVFNMISNTKSSAGNGPGSMLSRWAKGMDPSEGRIFTVSDDYVRRQREANRGALQQCDNASAELPTRNVSSNSILTSTFFRATNARIGSMVCNMRNRLSMMDDSDRHAGNYTQ